MYIPSRLTIAPRVMGVFDTPFSLQVAKDPALSGRASLSNDRCRGVRRWFFVTFQLDDGRVDINGYITSASDVGLSLEKDHVWIIFFPRRRDLNTPGPSVYF